MKIIPVLDVQAGQVVRGIGGRRSEYRPIVSKLCKTPEPLAVARSFRDQLHLSTLYLADLDAIRGAGLSLALYDLLLRDGFYLWLDAGLRNAHDAAPFQELRNLDLVAGLETVNGPDQLDRIAQSLPTERLIFSIDLRAGRPIGDSSWPTEPMAVADLACRSGIRRILWLDLAQVGSGAGTGTENLCAETIQRYPGVEVIAGGGVRNRDDLKQLALIGVSAVLVASALHDGLLQPKDWLDL